MRTAGLIDVMTVVSFLSATPGERMGEPRTASTWPQHSDFVQSDTTYFILGSTCLKFSVASYISENNLSLGDGYQVKRRVFFFLRLGCLALVLQRHFTRNNIISTDLLTPHGHHPFSSIPAGYVLEVA